MSVLVHQCDRCTTLMGDIDNREAEQGGGVGSIGEISVSSLQFCCESKTLLKNCLHKKKIILCNIYFLVLVILVFLDMYIVQR